MSDYTQRMFGLDVDEAEKVEKQAQSLMVRVAVSSVFFPLAHTKVLLQLGYEPFALTSGKLLYLFREAYFLPNGLVYTKKIYEKYGLATLYRGVQAHMMSYLTCGFVNLATTVYMDRHYPEIGGKPTKLSKNESELTDAESFRRTVRSAIREHIARSVGIIVARPFTVVMVRQIAQMVGNETKYLHVMSSLRLIGIEEGPKGLFSGIVPQLIAESISLWGVYMTIYGIERLMLRVKQNAERSEYEDDKIYAEQSRQMLRFVAPIIVNNIAYPFQVLSTVMAVAGSGLAVSLLPYSPPFSLWQDAYDYLKPLRGLQRGSRMFWREHLGPVTVGADQELYASNKYFI